MTGAKVAAKEKAAAKAKAKMEKAKMERARVEKARTEKAKIKARSNRKAPSHCLGDMRFGSQYPYLSGVVEMACRAWLPILRSAAVSS